MKRVLTILIFASVLMLLAACATPTPVPTIAPPTEIGRAHV